MTKEKRKTVSAAAVVPLLSLLVVLCEIGLMRTIEIGSLKNYYIHIPALFLAQTLLFVLTYFVFSDLPKKIAGLAFSISFASFICVWLFLIGFRHNVAALAVSSAFLCLQSLICLGYKRIKFRGVFAACLTLVFCMIGCFAGFTPKESAAKKRLKIAPIADFSSGFPHAVPVKKLYVFNFDNYDEELMLFYKSIQGHLGRFSDEQFFETSTYTPDEQNPLDERILKSLLKSASIEKSLTEEMTRIIGKYYPDVEIEYVDDFETALDKVHDKIDKFIRSDGSSESSIVALNLCNRFDAVVLSGSTLHYAEKYGWKQVYDTSGKDEKWLINSEFFDALNKSLVFLARPERVVAEYSDYAIVSGSWFVRLPDTVKKLEKILSYLDRNFIAIGGIGGLEERAVVSAASRYSGTFVFSAGMAHVAVLSSFRPENARIESVNTPAGIKKQTKDAVKEKPDNKHTVCVMLSDGDNMRFTAGEALVYDSYYGSERRAESLSCNYGMSGACALITPIVLLSYYDRMYTSEDFVMQLGSVGYVYPSHWRDDEAFKKVTDLLVKSMEVSDIRIVELMDDDSFLGGVDFPSRFKKLKPQFDKYTCYDQVDGCLFIDFMGLYAGYKGKMCWSNGKPVVSARYSIWNSIDNTLASDQNDVEGIAKAINASSRDVSSEDAYSFVIVHVWSGLDENGNLVPRGDTMAGVEKLISLLDDDVDVVTATEFISRIKNNVTAR